MATILHEKGARSPSLTDTIKVNGAAFDLTTSTVKFKMRLETSAVLKVDTAAVVVLASAGTVRYDWAAADVDTAGDYIGWWEVTLPGGKIQDTPQFSIRMVDLIAVALDTRALVGLRETKDWLEERDIDTGSDLNLTVLINDISQRFQDVCGREIKVTGTNPQTRLFDVGVSEYATRRVEIGDATTVTAVAITAEDGSGSVAVASTAYTLEPRIRESWEPITAIRFLTSVGGAAVLNYRYIVSVTGTWGFPQVPGGVRRAVLDAIAEARDSDVEHFRQDLSPVESSEGSNVVVIGRTGSQLLPLPPRAMAEAMRLRNVLVA